VVEAAEPVVVALAPAVVEAGAEPVAAEVDPALAVVTGAPVQEAGQLGVLKASVGVTPPAKTKPAPLNV